MCMNFVVNFSPVSVRISNLFTEIRPCMPTVACWKRAYSSVVEHTIADRVVPCSNHGGPSFCFTPIVSSGSRLNCLRTSRLARHFPRYRDLSTERVKRRSGLDSGQTQFDCNFRSQVLFRSSSPEQQTRWDIHQLQQGYVRPDTGEV